MEFDQIGRPDEVIAELDPGVNAIVVNGIMWPSLEEFCRQVPPKDPDLAKIWEAFGSKHYPPDGYAPSIHVNPWYRIARFLYPDSTPLDGDEERKLAAERASRRTPTLTRS